MKNITNQGLLNKHFTKKLCKYSNPKIAQKKAYQYLGKTVKIYPSGNFVKKYKLYDPNNKKWIYFGQMGYEDYTKHKDKIRRKLYLKRATHINGNWKNNKYSANNLAIHVLW